MADQHWSNHLVRGFPMDRESTVEITVNPSVDSPAVVLLASRLSGLVDALRERYRRDGGDPLLNEDPDDLYRLLDHLHRVRMVLQGQEERVLDVANQRGNSLETLKTALEVNSRETVAHRLRRIRRASEHGVTAAALDEDPLAANEPITDENEDED